MLLLESSFRSSGAKDVLFGRPSYKHLARLWPEVIARNLEHRAGVSADRLALMHNCLDKDHMKLAGGFFIVMLTPITWPVDPATATTDRDFYSYFYLSRSNSADQRLSPPGRRRQLI